MWITSNANTCCKCLKYKSREQSDLKKLEKLTTTFLTLMSKRD